VEESDWASRIIRWAFLAFITVPFLAWMINTRTFSFLILGAFLWWAGVLLKGAAYWLAEKVSGKGYAEWRGRTAFFANGMLSLAEFLPFLGLYLFLGNLAGRELLNKALGFSYGTAWTESFIVLVAPGILGGQNFSVIKPDGGQLSGLASVLLAVFERMAAMTMHVSSRFLFIAGLAVGNAAILLPGLVAFMVSESAAVWFVINYPVCPVDVLYKFYLGYAVAALAPFVLFLKLFLGR
jgi:hypothetical protein